MKTDDLYRVRDAAYKLECYPRFGDVTMRAWSSSDICLVDAVATAAGRSKPLKILVLNDMFGALSIPFHDHHTTVVVDSFLSQTAIRRNLKLNGLAPESLVFASSVQELEEKYDILLMGIHPSKAMFEYQLRHVRNALSQKCQIFAAAMSKNVDSALYTIFQRTLGPTMVLPTPQKTKLFQIELDMETKQNGAELRFSGYKAFVADTEFEVASGPGVFSADHLDAGARMILEHLPQHVDAEAELAVGDLGCGAGVLGAAALIANPNASAILVDDSRMALFSAKETFARNGIDVARAKFRLANGWDGTPDGSLDLVLCNLPADVDATHTPRLALQFLRQSQKVLKPGGKLLLAMRDGLRLGGLIAELFPSPVRLDHDEETSVVLATKQ